MKYKYSRDDIVKSETFDLALYGSRDIVRAYKKEVAKQSETDIISGIFGFIEANKICSFYKCVVELRKKHPDWYPVFQTRFMLFKAFIDSKALEKKGIKADELQTEYETLYADYCDLQGKVYEFLQSNYPDIELEKLNEFFSKL